MEHDVVSYSSGSRTPNHMIRSGDLKLMIAAKETNKSVDAFYDRSKTACSTSCSTFSAHLMHTPSP